MLTYLEYGLLTISWTLLFYFIDLFISTSVRPRAQSQRDQVGSNNKQSIGSCKISQLYSQKWSLQSIAFFCPSFYFPKF